MDTRFSKGKHLTRVNRISQTLNYLADEWLAVHKLIETGGSSAIVFGVTVMPGKKGRRVVGDAQQPQTELNNGIYFIRSEPSQYFARKNFPVSVAYGCKR
jgi:hypothetical protein